MSLSKDLTNIRENGTASLGELSEFLRTMKGRSPQEVLGAVAESSLVQSTVLATVATVVFLAIFTVGPYFLYPPTKPEPAKPTAQTSEPAADVAKKNDAAPATPDTAAQANPAASPTASSGNSNVDKAAKAMGIGEVKPADAKKNPLENNLENLLDNLK